MNAAIKQHNSGNLQQAEIRYRQILHHDPLNSDAQHLLGLIAYQVKKYDAAIACIDKAIALNPSAAVYHLNIGNAFKAQGDLKAALKCYEKAISLKPSYPDAHYNCGIILHDLGKLDGAVLNYKKAIGFNRNHAQAYNNLGNVLMEQGDLDAALFNYSAAVRLKPDYAFAHNNLGNILKKQGKRDQALHHYKEALRYNPCYADAHYNMGIIMKDLHQLQAAVNHFRESIKIRPDYAQAYLNLGLVLQRSGKTEESIKHYRKALHLEPDFEDAYNNLGVALKEQGKLEEAYECFAEALKIKPDFSDAHSNLLLNLHYHAGLDADFIYSEHKRFDRQHAAGLISSLKEHGNQPDPDRRLRIGYVSPDFRLHSVAFFLESVLAAHDHSRFEIFCYADVEKPDHVTARLRGSADVWHDIRERPHEEVAELVQNDKIDILIDLAGHTSNNRMPLFARKPAPVQVTWLGYPDTTGLTTMDYRITDWYADPAGDADKLSAEELVRLPQCFLSYRPPEESPEIGELPALKNGYITFGSFNNLNKVNPEVVAVWCRILEAAQGSRLIIKSNQLSDKQTRDRYREMFLQRGISADRVELMSAVPSLSEHLCCYNLMDIALDPFPYNGTTTTCETLWMGVPAIVPAGDRHSGRVGASLLTAAGLTDFISTSPDDYVARAVNLAGDIERLKDLRRSLRGTLLKSPLTDSGAFTLALEGAYRRMWQQWCRNRGNAVLKKAPPPKSAEKKLHIGGSIAHPGWEVFNAADGPHVEHVGDARDLSRFGDGTFAQIYASHVLEHFDYTAELPGVLKEWYRVLTPGAKLFISVPDMDKLCRLFLMKDKLTTQERFQVMRMMFGGQVDKYDYHRAGFNREFLESYLHKAGFENITAVENFGIFKDTSAMQFHGFPISLNIVSQKPDSPCAGSKRIRTAAKEIEVFHDDLFLVSYPRSGNTWLRFLLAWLIHDRPDLNFTSIEHYAPDLYRHDNASLLSAARPRIIKSHERYCRNYPRVVYVYRDVRDVIVSFFHYLKKQGSSFDFETYFNQFISGKIFQNLKLGTWDDNVKSWLSHDKRIIAVRYEDMLDNPADILPAILNHLGLKHDKTILKEAVKKYSFDKMSQIEQTAEDVDYLSSNRKIRFIRQGEKGQWKTVLNREQLAVIKEKYGRLLIELGYEKNLDWGPN